MTKRMLIDAAHAEETRVVVVDGSRIEELDFEIASKRQLRGNIYLAKVTRVEPSLQAAFIEYGGNRHGFLAFNEIHPDYYQIPVADREALMREAAEEDDEDEGHVASDDDDDDMDAEVERRRRRLMRRYKIQEVIKRRQIMLVQVVKEERGNKGAALTTYLSLAGRYCVLMPNTARGGGISRKITNASDRRRLKSATSALDVPHGMGLIVRTAGAARTKAEIKRDYEYLLRMWSNIRDTTLKSIAPALIYEEEDLVKRAIRDMFDKDLESIEVEGAAGYREARDFMRMIMPSQAKKIIHYTDPTPLFVKHKVEDQIAGMHSPTVQLRSGGYLVINQTEALVAIDVNSGRATRERNIETTALKTNLEAAEEAARQLRLRDLAGLIVIDFIDMDEGKNNRAVEKRLADCLKDDRARLQMGKISQFGLMEISRQRRRLGVLEGATNVCPHCQGAGRVRSVESSALAALRAIEMEAVKGAGTIIVRLPTAVGLYILNEKRAYLSGLETERGLHVTIALDDSLAAAEETIERTETREDFVPRVPLALVAPSAEPEWVEPVFEDEDDEDESATSATPDEDERDEQDGDTESRDRGRGRSRGRRRRGGNRDERGEDGAEHQARSPEELDEVEGDQEESEGGVAAGDDSEEGHRRRRRRGRRGGKRMREETGTPGQGADPYAWTHPHGGYDTPHPKDDPYAWKDPHGRPVRLTDQPKPVEAAANLAEAVDASVVAEPVAERSGRGRRNRGRRSGGDTTPVETGVVDTAPVESAPMVGAVAAEPEMEDHTSIEVSAPKRRRVKKAVDAPTTEAAPSGIELAQGPTDESAPAVATEVTAKPKRTRRSKAAAEAGPVETVIEQAISAVVEFMSPPAEVIAEAEPAPVTAPQPAATPVEPDPAEISAPPEKPKRGWWGLRR
ncbi:MAG: Rne/Rng family ribonuclease [Pseudomonadota bacterium]|nr:Rne/Rng family ribonuclease [Pseudomonadota bacterium]